MKAHLLICSVTILSVYFHVWSLTCTGPEFGQLRTTHEQSLFIKQVLLQRGFRFNLLSLFVRSETSAGQSVPVTEAAASKEPRGSEGGQGEAVETAYADGTVGGPAQDGKLLRGNCQASRQACGRMAPRLIMLASYWALDLALLISTTRLVLAPFLLLRNQCTGEGQVNCTHRTVQQAWHGCTTWQARYACCCLANRSGPLDMVFNFGIQYSY